MSDFAKLSLTGKSFIVLFISYAVIFLYVLWTEQFANLWFYKISITYMVVAVVLALVYLVRREFAEDEQMKNDKYMD